MTRTRRLTDPFAGLMIIDAGGTISADQLDSQSKNDQLELMQAMVEQQRDPEIFEWVKAACAESSKHTDGSTQ